MLNENSPYSDVLKCKDMTDFYGNVMKGFAPV